MAVLRNQSPMATGGSAQGQQKLQPQQVHLSTPRTGDNCLPVLSAKLEDESPMFSRRAERSLSSSCPESGDGDDISTDVSAHTSRTPSISSGSSLLDTSIMLTSPSAVGGATSAMHTRGRSTSVDGGSFYRLKLGDGKSLQLWQFLMDLLQKGNRFSHVIHWTNNFGEFRLSDPDAVSKLWGQCKGKNDMNYDKMSRAMRYYYEKGVLKKALGKRYTYRFSESIMMQQSIPCAGNAPDQLVNTGMRRSSMPSGEAGYPHSYGGTPANNSSTFQRKAKARYPSVSSSTPSFSSTAKPSAAVDIDSMQTSVGGAIGKSFSLGGNQRWNSGSAHVSSATSNFSLIQGACSLSSISSTARSPVSTNGSIGSVLSGNLSDNMGVSYRLGATPGTDQAACLGSGRSNSLSSLDSSWLNHSPGKPLLHSRGIDSFLPQGNSFNELLPSTSPLSHQFVMQQPSASPQQQISPQRQPDSRILFHPTSYAPSLASSSGISSGGSDLSLSLESATPRQCQPLRPSGVAAAQPQSWPAALQEHSAPKSEFSEQSPSYHPTHRSGKEPSNSVGGNTSGSSPQVLSAQPATVYQQLNYSQGTFVYQFN